MATNPPHRSDEFAVTADQAEDGSFDIHVRRNDSGAVRAAAAPKKAAAPTPTVLNAVSGSGAGDNNRGTFGVMVAVIALCLVGGGIAIAVASSGGGGDDSVEPTINANLEPDEAFQVYTIQVPSTVQTGLQVIQPDAGSYREGDAGSGGEGDENANANAQPNGDRDDNRDDNRDDDYILDQRDPRLPLNDEVNADVLRNVQIGIPDNQRLPNGATVIEVDPSFQVDEINPTGPQDNLVDDPLPTARRGLDPTARDHLQNVPVRSVGE